MMTDSEFDAREARRENPTGWMLLVQHEHVRLAVDALLESPPGHEFPVEQLARRAGLTDDRAADALAHLETVNAVEHVDTVTWRLNDDAPVMEELFHLNSAVNAARSG